jgi:hypothetical protein
MKIELAESFVAAREAVNLAEPTLRGLSHLLRHRELWPPYFEWNYGDYENALRGWPSASGPLLRMSLPPAPPGSRGYSAQTS